MIDDDPKLASFVKMGLEDHGHRVILAYDSRTGENIASSKSFDVILLDVMLPGMTGFELCRHLRVKQIDTPVLMLTSLDSTDDVGTGLEHGADDYLSKPFDFTELLARITALDRRHKNHVVSPLIQIADLEIDTLSKSVRRAGRTISLTAKEYKILELVAKEPGKVFDRYEIAQKVWGFEFNIGTNVIDVHVAGLRKKIDKPFNIKLINTIKGLGYQLKPSTP